MCLAYCAICDEMLDLNGDWMENDDGELVHSSCDSADKINAAMDRLDEEFFDRE